MTIFLGTFTQDAVPAPLEYTYRDDDGVVIDNITSPTWTVKWRQRHHHRATGTEVDATATAGVAQHVWADDDMAVAGVYDGEFAATDGVYALASERISWRVRAAARPVTAS